MTDSHSTDLIRDKIIGVLKIYPKISPSMLQIGIGSSLPATFWRPVLEALIAEGVVVQEDIVALTATDRHQMYKTLSLVESAAA